MDYLGLTIALAIDPGTGMAQQKDTRETFQN
jgi:hypothetical protein